LILNAHSQFGSILNLKIGKMEHERLPCQERHGRPVLKINLVDRQIER